MRNDRSTLLALLAPLFAIGCGGPLEEAAPAEDAPSELGQKEQQAIVQETDTLGGIGTMASATTTNNWLSHVVNSVRNKSPGIEVWGQFPQLTGVAYTTANADACRASFVNTTWFKKTYAASSWTQFFSQRVYGTPSTYLDGLTVKMNCLIYIGKTQCDAIYFNDADQIDIETNGFAGLGDYKLTHYVRNETINLANCY